MPLLIHPTALVANAAQLAADVRVGPYAVIDGPVILGPGCVVGAHAIITGFVTAGRGNEFGQGCVIGGPPQHLGYKGEPTRVEIGDFNVFREHVTVHRAMPATGVTTIGNHNLFMVNSHVAHDCRVGSHCLFANGAVIGGHSDIADRALLSGNTCVHQFCRVGKLALLSGTSSVSQDLPPFWIVQGGVNIVHGVNVVGMKRAGYSLADVQAVRRAFRILHLQGHTISAGLSRIERELDESAAVRELIEFVRASKRGICSGLSRARDAEEPAERHDPIRRAA